MTHKMPDHITDGPQTPEDYDDLYRSEDRAIECPACGEIAMYPTKTVMWECDKCGAEAQFGEGF